METIKLTLDQKKKLIEMCNKLFPKFSWGNSFEKRSFDNELVFCDSEGCVSIHWFEFCMTHLIPRLKKFGIKIDCWLMTCPQTHCQWPKDYKHPVDYVYFEFKKKFP
jgi:hypothetical protein